MKIGDKWRVTVRRKNLANGSWGDLVYCDGIKAVADECTISTATVRNSIKSAQDKNRIPVRDGLFILNVLEMPAPKEKTPKKAVTSQARTQRKLCEWCKVSLLLNAALVLVLGVVVLI